jgi:hypothetical protein
MERDHIKPKLGCFLIHSNQRPRGDRSFWAEAGQGLEVNGGDLGYCTALLGGKGSPREGTYCTPRLTAERLYIPVTVQWVHGDRSVAHVSSWLSPFPTRQ